MLTSITATSQAFAVSSRLRVVAVANLLIALSFVVFMVNLTINNNSVHCLRLIAMLSAFCWIPDRFELFA